MKNVDMKVNGDKLIITVDLTKEFGLSWSCVSPLSTGVGLPDKLGAIA
jgi:hypothetical protein